MPHAIELNQPAGAGRHAAPRAAAPDRDLETAIGLVWGHLGARQFHQAAVLARGCLALWPGQPMLVLLGAHAANELGQAPAPEVHALLREPAYAPLAALVLRRAAAGSAEATC